MYYKESRANFSDKYLGRSPQNIMQSTTHKDLERLTEIITVWNYGTLLHRRNGNKLYFQLTYEIHMQIDNREILQEILIKINIQTI